MALSTLKNRIASEVFSRLPSSVLKSMTKVNPLIAYYHVVSDEHLPHIKHLYPIRGIEQFRSDIDTFLRLYKPITLHELLTSIRGGQPLAPDSFLLTFDDGFREIYEIIAPILLKKGVPASFFLATAFLDNLEMAHHNKISLLLDHLAGLKTPIPAEQIGDILSAYGIENSNVQTALLSIDYRRREAVDKIAVILDFDFNSYLSSARPFLTSTEVRWLINKGFTIGAHSIDHPKYSALSLDDQLYQTRASTRLLRERFSLTYGAFAFPHGDKDVKARFFEEMFAEGDVDVSFGTGGMLKDAHPRHFQRFSMEYDSAPAKKALGRHYSRSLFKGLIGRQTMNRT